MFNFVEQVTGIRLAKTKNIDNNDWKLLLSDIDAKLPGVREFWPNADEDDLLLRIEKLNIPTCPAPSAQLRDLLLSDWSRADVPLEWKDGFGSLTKASPVSAESIVTKEQEEAALKLQRLRILVESRQVRRDEGPACQRHSHCGDIRGRNAAHLDPAARRSGSERTDGGLSGPSRSGERRGAALSEPGII